VRGNKMKTELRYIEIKNRICRQRAGLDRKSKTIQNRKYGVF